MFEGKTMKTRFLGQGSMNLKGYCEGNSWPDNKDGNRFVKKDWICSCSTQNFERSIRCRGCRQLKSQVRFKEVTVD